MRGYKSEPITPDDLPRWVPGELILDSAPLGWDGMRLAFPRLDVAIPALNGYMIGLPRRALLL